MEKIFCHICCAPCYSFLKGHLDKNFGKTALFFKNPNIHPFTEFQKRLKCAEDYASSKKITFIKDENYNVKDFLREIVFREESRCLICARSRLYSAARLAKASKFKIFTTTMLSSSRMNHRLIKELGLEIGKELKIKFYYYDFRKYKKEAYNIIEKENFYRQNYCGCIYSEEERFKKTIEKKSKPIKI